MIEYLPFDSDKFGIKVGNLTFPESFDERVFQDSICEARNLDYDLLYVRGIEIPSALLTENIKLVDEKIIYTQKNSFSNKNSFFRNIESVIHQPLTCELLALAYESGKFSRYKYDELLPDFVFQKLYHIWIDRSLKGEIATDVLAYKENGRAKGFITFSVKESLVEIGLIATSPDSARIGIGSKLINCCMSQFPIGTQFSVATQKRNEAACRFYEKNGFDIKSIEKIYHIWVK